MTLAAGLRLGPHEIAARSRPLLMAAAVAAAVAAHPAVAVKDKGRPPATYAVLINGGASPRMNYLSHLHHLQDMAAELRSRGIPPERITVFSADGEDSKPDLAAREPENEDQWLIEGTQAGSSLTQPDLTNTTWEGVQIKPARMRDLRQWFAHMSGELHPGDTLFVFVTDHGNRDAEDAGNGTISLWNESLSLLEFRALLAHLQPGVRVVNVMSQCFSGAFSDAMAPLNSELPSGDVCGFYSTPRDRPAYGCYPEGRDRDRMGHGFRFIEAMSRHGALDEVHDAVLLLDTSPDVPIRTSDLYLERLLSREAEASGKPFDDLVDEKLALAWKNRAHWEPEIRLMDRIGEVYGFPSPRTLAELKPRLSSLQSLSRDLDTYEDRWKLVLDELRKENLDKLIEHDPAWKPKLEATALEALDRDAKKTLLMNLLAALKEFTAGRPEIRARLDDMRATYDDARKARYVVDVRLAAILRMRALLIRVAGLRFLEHGEPSDAKAGAEHRADWQRALDGLTRCESTVAGTFDPSRETAVLHEAPEPLPPLASDLAAAQRALPSWMGIRFAPLSDAQRTRFDAERGAVFIQQVIKDGPASVAGLKVGDVLVGPPGRHFSEPNQIREWTMTSPRGTPLALDILRDGKPAVATITLGAYPTEIPSLPPPPQQGDQAPKLGSVRAVRPENGEMAELEGVRHMLFFWATWCAPCKASIPQLLAWSGKTGVPVIAISDEDEDTIRKFLKTWTKPFPERVVSDELRQAYLDFAVSGTPTFVLVDASGKIEWRHTGFSAQDGLAIP
jgi:thiol-disulfide isomerase/thioredoxin